jgi:hypothetical protein
MFSIEFGDFFNNPLYVGSNSAELETIFLRIFQFNGPSKRQTV